MLLSFLNLTTQKPLAVTSYVSVEFCEPSLLFNSPDNQPLNQVSIVVPAANANANQAGSVCAALGHFCSNDLRFCLGSADYMSTPSGDQVLLV